MAKKLTKEIAYKEFHNFFQGKPFVLFGTGMSCAVDNKFGMGYLEKHLLYKLARGRLDPAQQTEWNSVVKSLNSGLDFVEKLGSGLEI